MSLNPDRDIQEKMSKWLTSITPQNEYKPRPVGYQISDADSITSLMADFWTVISNRIGDYISLKSPELYREIDLFTFPFFTPTVDYQNLIRLQNLLLECKPLCLHFGRPITLLHYHPEYLDNNRRDDRYSPTERRRVAPYASFSINTFYRNAQVDLDADPSEANLSTEELLERGMKKIMDKIQQEETQKGNDITGVLQDIYGMVELDLSNIPPEVREQAEEERKLASLRKQLEKCFSLSFTQEEESAVDPQPTDDSQMLSPYSDNGAGPEIFYPESPNDLLGYLKSEYDGMLAPEEFANIQNWVSSQTGEQTTDFQQVSESAAENMYRIVWKMIDTMVLSAKKGTNDEGAGKVGLITPNFLASDATSFYLFVSSITKTIAAFPLEKTVTVQWYHPQSFDGANRSPCPMMVFSYH